MIGHVRDSTCMKRKLDEERNRSMRICSLVPSGTEIVCALGLADQLVGVSHRCDYPPEVVRKPIVSSLLVKKEPPAGDVGGASAQHPVYELDADLVRALAPELIL